MKIYITGPSGGGKSTIASWLSELLNLKAYHGDDLLYKFSKKKRVKLKERTYGPKLKKIAKKDNWIFEGKIAYEPIMKEADWIIWLNNPFYVSLWQQWKRFFTDKEQRQKYGFKSNFVLSWRMANEQFFGRLSKEIINDPKCVHKLKMKNLLRKYKNKLTILMSASQIRKVVINEEIASQEEVDDLSWE